MALCPCISQASAACPSLLTTSTLQLPPSSSQSCVRAGVSSPTPPALACAAAGWSLRSGRPPCSCRNQRQSPWQCAPHGPSCGGWRANSALPRQGPLPQQRRRRGCSRCAALPACPLASLFVSAVCRRPTCPPSACLQALCVRCVPQQALAEQDPGWYSCRLAALPSLQAGGGEFAFRPQFHLTPSHPFWLQDQAALKQQKSSGWLPKAGQSVFVPRLGKRAKVVAVDGASGALTLQAGLIKITATPDEVRRQ